MPGHTAALLAALARLDPALHAVTALLQTHPQALHDAPGLAIDAEAAAQDLLALLTALQAANPPARDGRSNWRRATRK